MDIKHISFNPKQRSVSAVIIEAQRESKEWCFERIQPITEYEWIAIFMRFLENEQEKRTQEEFAEKIQKNTINSNHKK